MCFILFFFFVPSLFSCRDLPFEDRNYRINITYSSVAKPDLLPKPLAERFGLYESSSTRVLVCHNSSLSVDFAILRHKVLGEFGAGSYRDEIIVGNARQLNAVEIEINDPKPLLKQYFNFSDETIIACVSEGPWLVFLTKNGLFSMVEIQKNEGKQQEDKPLQLLNARFHSQGSLPKAIHDLDLNEKNCNLTYNDSEKAFVFSYVSLLPFFPKIPDAKPNGEPDTFEIKASNGGDSINAALDIKFDVEPEVKEVTDLGPGTSCVISNDVSDPNSSQDPFIVSNNGGGFRFPVIKKLLCIVVFGGFLLILIKRCANLF